MVMGVLGRGFQLPLKRGAVFLLFATEPGVGMGGS